jgi:hypothetical protein
MKRRAYGSMASPVCVAVAIGLFSLMIGGPCGAQVVANQHSRDVLVSSNLDSATTPVLAIAEQPPASDAESTSAATPASPQVGEPTSNWHLAVSPYLWFPGVHGTIGARGHDASIHVSPGDLLSHFRFGLMGLVDTRYKRIVLPLDIVWVRLGANNALALTDNAVSARIRGSEFILTPKVGYRLVDSQIVKIDALTGFRYWHFGESLTFSPSSLGLKFSRSQNWVDPLVGGRITANLSPKISATIAGDVGGWNTGSVLDYQIAGVLGYRIKPAVVLQAGYRYLAVDYRNGGAKINTVTSGALIGATITLK